MVRPRIAEIAIGEAVEGIAADMAGLARDRRDVAQRRRVHRHALGRVAERVEIRDAAIGQFVALEIIIARGDRKSVVEGKSVSVRLDLGGRRLIKKKKKQLTT